MTTSCREEWMAHSLTTVNVIPYTKSAKQPLLNSGNGGIGVLDKQYSSMASCTVNFEDYGFYANGSSIIGCSNIGYRDYLDLMSSDSGSLFSFSDENSCSTESNRDSTSTDDFAETIFGDLGQLTSSGLAEDPYTMSSSNMRREAAVVRIQKHMCIYKAQKAQKDQKHVLRKLRKPMERQEDNQSTYIDELEVKIVMD